MREELELPTLLEFSQHTNMVFGDNSRSSESPNYKGLSTVKYSKEIRYILVLVFIPIFIVLAFHTARALTPEEIIRLKEAGISDEVIMEMIKKEKLKKSHKKNRGHGINYSNPKSSRLPGNIVVYVKTDMPGRVKVYFQEGNIWKQKGLLIAHDPLTSWTLAAEINKVDPGQAKIRLEFNNVDRQYSFDGETYSDLDTKYDDLVVPLRVVGERYIVVYISNVYEEGKGLFGSDKFLWRIKEAFYANLEEDQFVNRKTNN